MELDLTPQAGFPLRLDTSTLEVTIPGDIHFVQETRRLEDMRQVLYEPDAFPAETALYWNYKLACAGEANAIFQRLRLTFGLVLLPSLKVGREFVKSHGHYHSSIPESQVGYPEVYTHYFGELYLFMQRRHPGSDTHLDDCVLYKMIPGRSIMIPPGYAHILINPSGGPGLMGGLYSPEAVHDYGPIRKMAGGAYFFLEQAGLERVVANPRYPDCPPLRRIDELSGTCFAPPDGQRPLWSSFVAEPERYAFITDPILARRLFG